MASTTSPNMFLVIPGVGTQGGPDYALNLNSDLTLIDQHDHTLGKGVQITPAGMNINSDLSFNSNDLTNVGGIGFTALGANPSTLQFLYVSPGVETPLTEDLWFNDGNGNQIQITSGGTVNATIASLPGESYAAGTFFWVQGAGSTTPANFDIGSITLRPNVAATTFGVVLGPPSGIGSQYNINLPLLPASQSIVTIDNSGVMAAPGVYPITAASIANQTITAAQIATQTITATQIADHTITTTQISNTAGITGAQLATATVQQTNLASRTVNANGGIGGATNGLGGIAKSFAPFTQTSSTTSYTAATSAQTATISIASPAVISVASTATLYQWQPVTFTTTGALPTGITAGTSYFISNIISSTTFNISATLGGSNVNTSGSQSGTQTATFIVSSIALNQVGSRPVLLSLSSGGSATGSYIQINGATSTTGTISAIIGIFDSVTATVPISSNFISFDFRLANDTVSIPLGSITGFAVNFSSGIKNYIVKIKLVSTNSGASVVLTDTNLIGYEM